MERHRPSRIPRLVLGGDDGGCNLVVVVVGSVASDYCLRAIVVEQRSERHTVRAISSPMIVLEKKKERHTRVG